MSMTIKCSLAALTLAMVFVSASHAQTVQMAAEKKPATAPRSPFGEPIPAAGKPAASAWGAPIRLDRADRPGYPSEQPREQSPDSPGTTAQATPGDKKPGANGRWELAQGMPLHSQLAAWATAAGWHLDWKLNRSWLVPAHTQFTGSFDQAVEQVILALAAEGKPVELTIWEGNKVAEIIETSPR